MQRRWLQRLWVSELKAIFRHPLRYASHLESLRLRTRVPRLKVRRLRTDRVQTGKTGTEKVEGRDFRITPRRLRTARESIVCANLRRWCRQSTRQVLYAEDDNVCCICLTMAPNVAIHPCDHRFCGKCVDGTIAHSRVPVCPLCRGPIDGLKRVPVADA